MIKAFFDWLYGEEPLKINEVVLAKQSEYPIEVQKEIDTTDIDEALLGGQSPPSLGDAGLPQYVPLPKRSTIFKRGYQPMKYSDICRIR